jgi:hypothetical protein
LKAAILLGMPKKKLPNWAYKQWAVFVNDPTITKEYKDKFTVNYENIRPAEQLF